MLIITRKSGQALTIEPHVTLEPAIPVGSLFIDGPIEVVVKQIRGNQVKLGVRAHPGFMVLRDGYKGDKARPGSALELKLEQRLKEDSESDD